MKIFYFILFLFISPPSEAQDSLYVHRPIHISPIYTVKTNPFAVFLGPFAYTSEYRIVLENKTAQKQSIQLGLSCLGKNSVLKSLEQEDSLFQANSLTYAVRGFRLQLSYRFFLEENALEGFYFSPHVSYSKVNIYLKQNNTINKNSYIKGIYLNYAGMFGYQFVANNIAFDMFIGFGYRENAWSETYNNTTSPRDDLKPYLFKENFKMYLGFNAGISI